MDYVQDLSDLKILFLFLHGNLLGTWCSQVLFMFQRRNSASWMKWTCLLRKRKNSSVGLIFLWRRYSSFCSPSCLKTGMLTMGKLQRFLLGGLWPSKWKRP